MADEISNKVYSRIDQKLGALPPSFSEHTIFRVPRFLYEVNKKAYEPQIISIGPYHHGKDHLKMMEVHKLRLLRVHLRRTDQTSTRYYVDSIRGMVEKARNCYALSSNLSSEDFLEMLVLDGCFIVELIHQLLEGNNDEYLIRWSIVGSTVWRDLVLFENQLPFFVLLELFGTMRGNYDTKVYVHRFLLIYQRKLPGLQVDHVSVENVNHLLHLVQKNWLPSSDVMEDFWKAPRDGNWSFIHSATGLRDAGIRFKKGKGNSLFDIKFRNGVVEIPMMSISDTTESLYRNVIVSEQFENGKPRYLTDFTAVLICLVNTRRDVELLCRCGIIDNMLGDDEVVAAMFNRLGDHVGMTPIRDFFYAKVCYDINEHYNSPWNKRMASLRHNYFNTPWALISFVAAVFLLVLTLLQTIFTLFPRS